ncbi:MAG: YggS family pyridoxal phosphate-dependent enzyme [Pseudomonadota bacterium]
MGLDDIRSRVAAAATKAGRAPEAIRLIAVSKKQPEERVRAVIEAGHVSFGENRVQEAAERWEALDPGGALDLHLVGPLQTNKARQAMGLFGTIHSVDRLKLAQTIARLAEETGACPDLFVQVNTGEEDQKAGVRPADADAFVAECRGLGLPLVGLMCLPPVDEEASLHFALLAKIAERNELPRLSMGMSGDFEVAIALGATDIRVGSAIFGSRPV